MISDIQRHRHSIRLKGYDYAGGGVYFVTVCTRNKECLFGEVKDGEMQLKKCGKVVEECWNGIPMHFPQVVLDRFVVMPNHVHGIVMVIDRSRGAVPAPQEPGGETPPLHQPGGETPPLHRPTLGQVIAYFKYESTKRINFLRCSPGAVLWQRNYYDRVIRNEEERIRIREYIVNNSLRWDLDRNCDDVVPW